MCTNNVRLGFRLRNMTSNSLIVHHTCRSVYSTLIFVPVHEISNNVVCATSKASDQPAHTRSLIRAFASRLSII